MKISIMTSPKTMEDLTPPGHAFQPGAVGLIAAPFSWGTGPGRHCCH